MTTAPNGLSKAADENQDAIVNAKEAVKTAPKRTSTKASTAESAPLPAAPEETPVPEVPSVNAPVPEGQVEIRRHAQEGENADPAGEVQEVRKQAKRATPKKDPLVEHIDREKLPLAAAVGQIIATVEEYAGNAVLSLSLKGWVGDAPLKIRAEDVGEIEAALAELRKALG